MESRVLSALLRAEYWDGSNYQQALAYGQQSLLIAGDLELKEQMAYTLTYLTLVYWSLDQMAAAREANLEALRAWQALDNRPMQAYTHSLTQLVHWFAGEYERSLSAANVGKDISRSTGDLWNQARASCYMAACYLEQGEYEQALASLTEGIRLGEETHLISITSMSYRFLIRTYLAAGMLEMAEKAADKLYALCDSNVFMFRVIALGTIALAKVACGKWQETQRILDEIYAEIEIEKQPVILVGFVLLADTNLQLELGNHQRALQRASYLSERARQSGERLYLPEALWLQGKALVALAQHEEAHQVLKEAQAVAEKTEARRILWHILWELSRLETAVNHPGAAKHYHQQARKVVQYIAGHAGSGDVQASFLALPEVYELLSVTPEPT
jgi:tetratricopeptide (TPR) repeat protein